MMRWIVLFAVWIAVHASWVRSASADYILTDLGTLGGFVQPQGLNELGVVVGVSRNQDNRPEAFQYANGSISSVGILDSYPTSIINENAASVNDMHQIAGTFHTTAGNQRGYLMSSGTFTDLGTLGGDQSRGHRINNLSQVVGESERSDGTTRAFLYEGGEMSELGTLGGSYSSANDISDSGFITGSSATSDGSVHGFLYHDGNMIDVGTLGHPIDQSFAHRVNNHGDVIGLSYETGSGQQAFLYSDGVMQSLGIHQGQALDINDARQIVGTANDLAFLYEGGIVTILNDVIPEDSGWDLTVASGINESGQIIGWGRKLGVDENQGFLLTPVRSVPEPNYLSALLLICLVACIRIRSIRRCATPRQSY
ncbi:hypothetical protein LF1_41570 [Rubripirellula obstinata]|uniref:Uncharacterized protein n=1 Tax=Rubripirellula obstinata TaxID=406547 RepID=A0A5B1CM39_9BACT|nr:HAF repeat-containing protein [Rubripirellula obstinata]KAA1261606.1 hypothetical protein LF1_41570 [Rubripirellula obstinata]